MLQEKNGVVLVPFLHTRRVPREDHLVPIVDDSAEGITLYCAIYGDLVQWNSMEEYRERRVCVSGYFLFLGLDETRGPMNHIDRWVSVLGTVPP